MPRASFRVPMRASIVWFRVRGFGGAVGNCIRAIDSGGVGARVQRVGFQGKSGSAVEAPRST